MSGQLNINRIQSKYMSQQAANLSHFMPYPSAVETNNPQPIHFMDQQKTTYVGDASEERENLILQHLGLVKILAKRYDNRGIPLEDLVQVGIIGLIKAIQKYNPNNGAKLSTFATHYIIGEIKHNFRDNGWYFKVPRKIKDTRNQILHMIEILTNSLQRSPTILEIASRIGTTEENVIEILESNAAYTPSSLDKPDTIRINKDYSGNVDVLPGENFENVLIDRISLDCAKRLLTKRERTIVTLYFDYGMSQLKIAQELRISQVHVSRIMKQSLSKMKDYLLADKQKTTNLNCLNKDDFRNQSYELGYLKE